ncbi:MAG: cupin domain-containing protein [Cyanobacteria bacterium SW_9_44_58]|nr:MAG: cupin domain-containing protein [Cyanobacteria bacterium SW_9_44_58]
MLVKKLKECDEMTGEDGKILREVLHPDKHSLDVRYSFAHATLPVGQTSTPHSLTASEVYHIIQGKGEMHIDNETQLIEPGDTVYIPPNSHQYVHNCGDQPLVFICLVDPAWRPENDNTAQN